MTEFNVKDEVIYQEMMSHPALFMHPHPKKIAILGDDDCGILQEVLRHADVNEIQHVNEKPPRLIHHDDRTLLYTETLSKWVEEIPEASLDIIIIAEEPTPKYFKHFFKLLDAEGFLIQLSNSPFHVIGLKNLQEQFAHNGFTDIQFVIYSQPHFPGGMRTAVMAKKHGNFKRIREKDVYNRAFTTSYYNFDVHKASLVLPEFMRKELEPTT